jgi:HJR/Mrr/RecB family endonuclease
MGRPKKEKEKQAKILSITLDPLSLATVEEYQNSFIKVHGYRISRSQAIQRLILAIPAKDKDIPRREAAKVI